MTRPVCSDPNGTGCRTILNTYNRSKDRVCGPCQRTAADAELAKLVAEAERHPERLSVEDRHKAILRLLTEVSPLSAKEIHVAMGGAWLPKVIHSDLRQLAVDEQIELAHRASGTNFWRIATDYADLMEAM